MKAGRRVKEQKKEGRKQERDRERRKGWWKGRM